MLRQERVGDYESALRIAMTGWQAQIWTALPGIVDSFDPAKTIVVVQPGIKIKYRAKDGTESLITMPQLLDVPVVPMRGGGCTLTFPIKAGDECLVVFASRCIDNWWAKGGVQTQAEFRMHDLSDGFALVGPFSQKTKIKEWSTARTELRSDDHEAKVTVNPTTHEITAETTGKITAHADQDIKVTSGTNITMQAPRIDLNP